MTETTLTALTAESPTPNLNKALSQLQGKLPKVTKGNTADIPGSEGKRGYKYSYADLADVTAAVGPLLAEFGLAFFAKPTIDPGSRGQMVLVWKLKHESGEEEAGEYPLGPANQRPQSLGSAITYARRYCLSAATGIVAEDDDDGQRAQQDHSSRQAAGDVFDQASAAPPRQGRPQPSPPAPEAIDAAAQAFADEAAKARTPAGIEAIHKRAREAGKVAALIRNPSSGGTGKLAIYLEWMRKQLVAAGRLDPDDPWAAKVEELASDDDAAAAIAELTDLLSEDKIDGERFRLVQAAIEARFPHSEEQAAA